MNMSSGLLNPLCVMDNRFVWQHAYHQSLAADASAGPEQDDVPQALAPQLLRINPGLEDYGPSLERLSGASAGHTDCAPGGFSARLGIDMMHQI
jgi:hypothetical protein